MIVSKSQRVDHVVIPSGHVITLDFNVKDDDKNNVIEMYDSEDYEYCYNIDNDSFDSVEYLYNRNLIDYLDDYLNSLN
ncbi:hypothetical protein ENUP19_0159G0015 [Entamoeba nuttalli]|uniref:Uncharacterized protein n=1 Tax=Entamoeba nuttalli TaxID=412467 RepID=A0ABQ0DLF4_9EUKA